MKIASIFASLCIACTLAACQSAPSRIEATRNSEFSLTSGQSASIRGTDLTITFHYVLSDDRCPSELECADSGPVTISLSVQRGDAVPSGITLETFTDQEGRSPGVPFEGIQDSVEAGDYIIRVLGVVPYPRNLSGIKASDYQATLTVTPKP